MIGLITLLCVIISPPIVNAQAKSRFGIKGGINLSQLYINDSDLDDENMKVGFHAGVYAIAPLSEAFFIQPELIFSSAGTKATYKGSSLLGIQAGEVRFNLNYIQLPILFSGNLGPVSLQAGPYASYLINANVSDVKNDGTVASSRELNTEDFNKLDYGIALGAALNINVFQMGLRYNYGLREVGKSDFGRRMTKDSKNAVAQIFVGVAFGSK